MTSTELQELLEELRAVESDMTRVEVKRASKEVPQRLWQTFSAFANTVGGGTILLGVDESTGFEVTGVEAAGKMQADLASVADSMEPPLRPQIEVHRLRGKQVIVVEIAEVDSSSKPCFHKSAGLTNGAFIRVADGDRKLTPYEVQVLIAGRGQPREDEMVVKEATEDDLDSDLVAALLKRLRSQDGSYFKTINDERALQTLRAVQTIKGKRYPTLAGMLTLGKYPQEFFPALRATLVVYPTNYVGEPGPNGERFLDDKVFDGPIPRLVGPILSALKRNMKKTAVVRGAAREESWEYPELAIREAVVNALVHRDLSGAARGSPVQIQMFPDRLTITNPGGLHGPVTVEQLGETGISSARNQVLMKLLEDIAGPGEPLAVCENRGSGIGAMLASLRLAGMSPPTFEDRVSTFSVTFPNHTLLDGETVRWLGTLRVEDLTDAQRMALALMRHGEVLSNATLRQTTGLDSRVVTRDLQVLVQRGLVTQTGSRRWATYQLVEHKKQPVSRRDRRREIIELLRSNTELTTSDIAKELVLTSTAVRHWLAIMRRERTIEATEEDPRSPKTKYRLRRSSEKKS
ncbi:MAG: putative DNA binding domain-containing protein [Myxococcaceae bacterium]|nr:putative DNA binding domain-containing protein [Myxococcaceae bacterium]